MATKTKVVLDSWPVLEASEGSQHAISAMNSLLSEQIPIMSAINYAETYNSVLVKKGIWEARDIVKLLGQVVALDIPNLEIIMQAAHLKSSYYMALGDSFAVATALYHDAELWTGDVELLFRGSPWRIRDLRPGNITSRPLTRKEQSGKIGPRPRSRKRPNNEPDIALNDLMTFLENSPVL